MKRKRIFRMSDGSVDEAGILLCVMTVVLAIATAAIMVPLYVRGF